MAPSQDASDNQDDITCLGSGIPKKTFTDSTVTGRGPYPRDEETFGNIGNDEIVEPRKKPGVPYFPFWILVG